MSKFSCNTFEKVRLNGIEFYKNNLFEKYNVFYAFCGDKTNMIEDMPLAFGNKRLNTREIMLKSYEKLLGNFQIDFKKCILINAVHGNTILRVGWKESGLGIYRDEKLPECDGILTDEVGLPIASIHADCVPIALFDKRNRAVCVIHAGWHGVLSNIMKSAVDKMKDEFNSFESDILISIGPMIEKCCFEVSKDLSLSFLDKFDCKKHIVSYGEKDHIDLKGIIVDEFLNNGVRSENICAADICTCCLENNLHSFRRDGQESATMVQIMMLK